MHPYTPARQAKRDAERALDPTIPPYKGNGRPPVTRDKAKDLKRRIELACKRLSGKALMVLEKALDETKTPDLDYRYRIAAASQVLDRAWGKPKQQIDQKVDVTVTGYGDMLEKARLRAMGHIVGHAVEAKIVDAVAFVPEQSDPLLDASYDPDMNNE